MKNKLLSLFAAILSLSFVTANGDYWGMGPGMMYSSGSGSYSMMGGMGIFGGLTYLLVIINLIFLAIFLYKKIWNEK